MLMMLICKVTANDPLSIPRVVAIQQSGSNAQWGPMEHVSTLSGSTALCQCEHCQATPCSQRAPVAPTLSLHIPCLQSLYLTDLKPLPAAGATRAPALPPPVLPGLLHSMMPQPAGPPAGLGPSYLPIPSFTRRISGAVAQAAGAQPGAAGPSGGPPMPGAGSSGAGPAAMQVDQCAGPASGAQVNAHPRGQPQGPIQVPQPQKTVLRKVRDLVASVRAQPPEMVDILCRVGGCT
jgi:hypothetical protein